MKKYEIERLTEYADDYGKILFLNVGLSVRNPKLERYITFETEKQ